MVSEAKAPESAPEQQPSQEGVEESTSNVRTYSQEEHEKLVTDAVNAKLGEIGRKHKRELDSLERRITEAHGADKARLERELQKRQDALDELAADDEDKTRLSELLKNATKREQELADMERKWAPRIARAEDVELTELCNEVARDFDGADAARLKRIASRTKFSDDEDKIDQIRSLAEDIWPKKTVAPPPKEEPPRKVDSQVTSGGGHGKTPTLEELRQSTPEETDRRVKSGEWVLPRWK